MIFFLCNVASTVHFVYLAYGDTGGVEEYHEVTHQCPGDVTSRRHELLTH